MDHRLLLMYYNPGYLKVQGGGWTCIACMDRKVRDLKHILRHEKSEGHACAVAAWLQRIDDSFPDTPPSSTNVKATASTLQDLLLALADEQEEMGERDTPGMAGSMDGEGSNEIVEIPALSVSLLGRFDGDEGLGAYLELEGRDHGSSCLDPPPVLFSSFVGGRRDKRWPCCTTETDQVTIT